MSQDRTARGVGGDAEWLLSPEELCSLRSTRRFLLLGLSAAGGLSLGLIPLAAWVGTRQPRLSLEVAALALACLATGAGAVWFACRARIVGQDIRNGRAQMQWGQLTRLWGRLRVVEVEGMLFPLQVTPVPALQPGERVYLRFAPRSRITLEIQTLRQVVAAEGLAGRAPCAGVLAELGEDRP